MMDPTVDTNNNDAAAVYKYSLRPRVTGRKGQQNVDLAESTRPCSKGTQILSRYRRRSANARERSRMREINEAFESLRRVVTGSSEVDQRGEKMTKISTLRLAMKYISTLSEVLENESTTSVTKVPSMSMCRQYGTVPSDMSSTSNTLDTTGHQTLFNDQYIIRSNIRNIDSNVPFVNATYVESAKSLNNCDVENYYVSGYSKTNDLTNCSNVTLLSNCGDSEHPFHVESPPPGFTTSQAPSLSTIPCFPLPTASLEELLITR